MTGAGDDAVRKRSVTIAGHTTSVSLEAPFWEALREIADRRGLSLNALVAEVDAARAGADAGDGAPARGNLSSALRVYVLRRYRQGEAS